MDIKKNTKNKVATLSALALSIMLTSQGIAANTDTSPPSNNDDYCEALIEESNAKTQSLLTILNRKSTPAELGGW